MAATSSLIHSFYEKVCAENLPKVPLFGVSLDRYMESQKKNIPFLNEPFIVRKCCQFLLEKGLDTEGIFRVPGSYASVEKIVELFEQGKNPNFDSIPAFVEDVAGVLKKYLRDQPDPLISDGTPGDPLQKQFLAAITSYEEGSPELINELARLVILIPTFRKAVLVELFGLLNRVAERSTVNLMNPDNIATIFGGMTNIVATLLSSPQRSMLVRMFTTHYNTIFGNIDSLERRPDDQSLDNVRDAVRIYLYDGTFKSLFVQGSETEKSITKKTHSKLQQTMDIDMSNYKMYELRNMSVRKIGSDEKLLSIWKSGSAILFTDKIKTNKKRSVSKATKGVSKDGQSLNQEISLKNDLKLSGTETEFATWIFYKIPTNSTRASEWDLDSAVFGNIVALIGEESKVILKSDDKVLAFSIGDVSRVEDSSRYFTLKNEDYIAGIGFETGEMSSNFVKVIGTLDVNMKTPRAEQKTESQSQAFLFGPIDKLGDGFYDTGIIEDTNLPGLEELRNMSVSLDEREIILVDESKDDHLKKILESAMNIIANTDSTSDKLVALSLYVSNIMGGISLCRLFVEDDFSEEETSLEYLSRRSINFIKRRINSNVVPIGSISHGLSRHRAILFKYICEKLNICPSFLCKNDVLKNTDADEIYWVFFLLDGQIAYIDLNNHPGLIHKGMTPDIKELIEKIHGKLNVPSSN